MSKPIIAGQLESNVRKSLSIILPDSRFQRCKDTPGVTGWYTGGSSWLDKIPPD